ncbi:MAG: hypothetical protein ACRDKY_13890, partial [Solirubrobacteraceae bacterium]
LSIAAARVTIADPGMRTLAGLVVAVLALALLVRPDAIGGPLGGLVVPWPLLSCVAPLALPGVWRAPLAALERTSVRGPVTPALIRLGLAGALIGLATLVVAIAAPADGSPVAGDGLAAWRNAAFVSGLGLAGAALLPATYAWVAGTAYVLLCVAAGVPEGGEPYTWTLVLRPPDDQAALAVALMALGLGVGAALWSLRRPRLGPGARETSRAEPASHGHSR